MGKLNFKNGQVEDYTIVLSNRELQKQGQISNVKGVKHNGNLASAQVINFTVYKHQLFPDREEENFPYESIEAYQDYIDMEMDRGIRRGGNNYKRLVLEV